MLRSQIQGSGTDQCKTEQPGKCFPPSASLPSSEDGAGHCSCLCRRPGQLPHTALAQLSPTKHSQTDDADVQEGSWQHSKPPHSHSFQRRGETNVRHWKGPACRSSMGDTAALPVKSITAAALAQADCYCSHIRSLRLSCKFGLM